MTIYKTLLIPCFISIILTGCCGMQKQSRCNSLASIHIIDRNGFSETISNEDRLEKYASADFLSSMPYQKVMRIYSPDQTGSVKSYLTTYHSNGQPKQYLEVANGRAFGTYKEWHENGMPRLMAYVIGGSADLDPESQKTYLFEGISQAWNDEGQLTAEIPYEKGILQGFSHYYHPNGKLWRVIHYVDGKREGKEEIFLENGQLLQTVEYHEGEQHGPLKRFWSPKQIAAEEWYEMGSLQSGRYFDPSGEEVSHISLGSGQKPLFNRAGVAEFHEYKNGNPEGEVRILNESKHVIHTYFVKNSVKHGEEIFYYAPKTWEQDTLLQKLSIPWYEGKIHGVVKTWYPNGTLESQKEMTSNKKNGLLSAWYNDGNILMIEEYDRNQLLRGEYYKKGEKISISEVNEGNGEATLYDGDGNFLRKVKYLNGTPLE